MSSAGYCNCITVECLTGFTGSSRRTGATAQEIVVVVIEQDELESNDAIEEDAPDFPREQEKYRSAQLAVAPVLEVLVELGGRTRALARQRVCVYVVVC